MSEFCLHDYNSITEERGELIRERIAELVEEPVLPGKENLYFKTVGGYLLLLFETADRMEDGSFFLLSEEAQRQLNRKLYEDILPENYQESYANPAYAVSMFGEKEGRLLSFLYTEIRAAMTRIFEKRYFDLVIVAELFVEIYNHYTDCFREPQTAESREILVRNTEESVYYYAHDYSEIFLELKAFETYNPEYGFAYDIIMHSDLSDLRYLYRYGEYITENELKIAAFLNSMSEGEVQAMADTYTDGYVRGFTTMGADLSVKSVIALRYPIGFERMMRLAVRNFEKMGKKVTIYRAPQDTVTKSPGYRAGYAATQANPQFDYDHRYDLALYMDNRFKEHKLDCQKNAWEKLKDEMKAYAGPAVVETFGEPEFEPEAKAEACKPDAQQQKLLTEYRSEAGIISMNYIKDEEVSFTIIAYPLPSIGDDFEAVFAETVRLNNLDNAEYRQIQQCIIDVLDRGDTVYIKGCGGNRTDLTVNLVELTDPAKQTKFENCTADVNIPVGEVFTSPKLAGTNGVLHVSSVYLNGLEYKNLSLSFADGKITEYNCSNFDSDEENKRFIKENVLMNHETLPIGEFAIGTNTTAYRMGRKYDIQAKLPILIAEKTGPHFAVGDTCYSRSEDHALFNPDGKEIIARDNEISLLRKTDIGKAYFNCHTDITIPYDEIGLICACGADGSRTDIIRDGRFVLEGTEALNKALDE